MFLTLLILFFISSHGHGSPSYCEDLAKEVCSSEDSVDDTGATLKSNEPEDEVSSFFDARVPVYRDWFQKVLQSPEGEYFQTQAAYGLGLSDKRPCSSLRYSTTSEEEVSQCQQKLSEELVRLSKSQIIPGFEGSFNSSTALSELSPILKSGIYGQVKKRIEENIKKTYNSDDLKKRIESNIFPNAKKLLIAKIEAMQIGAGYKSRMKSKVQGILFDGTDCSDGADSDSSSLSGLFYQNARYYNNRNVFRYCDGFGFLGGSEAKLLFVIAHELAHAIDPCGMQLGYKATNFNLGRFSRDQAERLVPYPTLLKCLRNEKSIGAKVDPFTTSEAPWYLRLIDLEGIYKPSEGLPFCNHDQIGECAADWFAVEVLGANIVANRQNKSSRENLKYIKNAMRALCPSQPKSEKTKFPVHPGTYDRINKLLIRQPDIRRAIGCPTRNQNYGYCDGISEHPRMKPVVYPNQELTGEDKAKVVQ